MTNKQIAKTLRLTGDLIELTGGNAFRARAFGSASRGVDSLTEPVLDVLDADPAGVPSVGSGMAEDIRELVETGTFETLENLLSAIPPGLLDVLRIKGLGPKKVRALWTGLGVTSLDILEETATTGRIAELPGFGKKTQENLIEEIARVRSYMTQRHYAYAMDVAEELREKLLNFSGIEQIEIVGDLRRNAEVVSEIDLVIQGDEEAVRSALTSVATPSEGASEDWTYYTLSGGLPLRVCISRPEHFIYNVWRLIGSDAHVAAIGEVSNTTSDEEAIYSSAGFAFIPPELREDRGEFEWAANNTIPQLITTKDLRGTIHNHTTASDGAHSLREMAAAARAMSYEYLGVCDHSRSLAIANGLSIERLLAQKEEIAALNAEIAADGGVPFRIFHGTECDILPDGSMDFPDDVLAQLELVVASIHIRFGMTEQEATERLIRAIENPYVDVLGHPTGRLLLRREGYPIDHSAVIDACARHGVAIELNAHPYRLDMDWRFIHEATERGVMISINPDAHSIDELRNVRYGVAVARKGGLTAAQCLNALPVSEFSDWLAKRRQKAGVIN